MHSTAQKEQFSRAYVAAIAAQAGCNSAKPEVDDDSVDLTLKMKGLTDCRCSRAEIDIQLKCTANGDLSKYTLSYALPLKNYNDLRDDVSTPRLLVVVCVPKEIEDWTQQDEQQLSLRNCGYWLSLAGCEPTENESTVTVKIPRENVFSTEFLRKTMRKIANGHPL